MSEEKLHVVCPHCDTVNRVPRARLAEGGTCGRCGKALFTGQPLELRADNFDLHTGKSDLPVVVDFWASPMHLSIWWGAKHAASQRI